MTREYHYTCSECGYAEWSDEKPILAANECPRCDCGMTAAASRGLSENEVQTDQ